MKHRERLKIPWLYANKVDGLAEDCFNVFEKYLPALIPDIEQIDAMLVEARRTAKKQGYEEAIQKVIDMPHDTTHCDIIQTLKGEEV